MIYIFLFLTNVYANTFELKDSHARFKLTVTPTEVSFSSENLRDKIAVTSCNLGLARELNAEMLQAIHGKGEMKGVSLDGGKPEGVVPGMLDLRMIRFFQKSRKNCPETIPIQ